MHKRDSFGRWVKGSPSPNPAGRPKRSAVECQFAKHGPKLVNKAVELALAGDTHALQICLDRIAPPSSLNHRSTAHELNS